MTESIIIIYISYIQGVPSGINPRQLLQLEYPPDHMTVKYSNHKVIVIV